MLDFSCVWSFSKFVVLPHNQLSLFVRKISFLFSSCIFTLLYSVFKVLTWPLCGQLRELLLRLSPRFASQTVILLAFGTSFLCFCSLVGTSGLEPPTSRLSGVRSNHLSYAPIQSVSRLFSFLFSCPVVEMKRIELLTPCVQGRCSPSWATPPLTFLLMFQAFSFLFKGSVLQSLQNWTTTF